jgi:histidine ammonia-lyase
MIAEVTTAALMSENKHLANPCSTDSTPTSANQEDHVSMAAHGARRLERMNDNLNGDHRCRAAVRAQGVEFRAPLETSPRWADARWPRIRADMPPWKTIAIMAPDIAPPRLVASGAGRRPGLPAWPMDRGRMNPVEVIRGDGPVVLGMPHTGTCARRDPRG